VYTCYGSFHDDDFLGDGSSDSRVCLLMVNGLPEVRAFGLHSAETHEWSAPAATVKVAGETAFACVKQCPSKVLALHLEICI